MAQVPARRPRPPDLAAVLTASAALGYGPVCRRRIRDTARTAEVSGVKPEQHAKAVELIEAGGIVPTSRPGVFRTVSSDGTVVYLTHSATCTCPGGLHGRVCYHTIAARLIIAAGIRRAA